MNGTLGRLVAEALSSPRTAARQLLGLGISRAFVLQAAIVVAIGAAVVQFFLTALVAGMAQEGTAPSQMQPLAAALLQFGQILITAALVFGIGRMFGGTGDLDGALVITVFLGFMNLIWMTVMIISGALLAPLMGFAALAAAIWGLWALGSFVAELHGFSSAWKVIGVAFGLSFVLALIVVLALGGPVAMS